MTRTPHYRIHDGFRMPLGFAPEAFRSALGYRPRIGDVFLTAYPKCGTTWTQHIVHMILHRGEPLGPGARMSDYVPHLEEVGADAVRALPEPRIIKTHLPLALAPYEPAAKYVYLARNPFDCVVSFYHHTRGFDRHYQFADGSLADFFECFLAGEVDFGDYFDHLVPWCAHRDATNVLFLTYEHMKARPEAAIVSLGRFLGRHGEAVEDPEILARIVAGSSFESMSRAQARWSSRRPDGAAPFVRKGIVGDWKSALTPDQAARLAAKFRARTAGTRAAELWPEIVGAAEGRQRE
jgi:sulfotransferase